MGVLLVFAVSAPANADPSTGTVTLVKSAFSFWGVACPSSGACVAVGQNQNNVGLVDAVSNGVPGRPRTVPGIFGFGGVACPRANFCLAVGVNHYTTGVVVPVTNGVPGRPVAVPGALLYAIACGSATSCWATGESNNFKQALVVHIVNSRVARKYFLPGIYAGAFFGPSGNSPNVGTPYGPEPSCASASSCIAVGATRPFYGKSQGVGLVVGLVNGTVRAKTTVAGTAQLTGIGCLSATNCVADGLPRGPVYSTAPSLLVGVANGHPAGVVPVQTGGTYALSGITCAIATSCYAVARAPLVISVVPGSTPSASAATVVGGSTTSSSGFRGSFNAVSCDATYCVAAGGVYDPSARERAIGAIYSFTTTTG